MKASAANFLSIIKGPRQFVIPIYQRTYSWQQQHCARLMEDILRISRDTQVPGHFIGSVVYFQENMHTVSDVPQLLVIDGQQRLTTISLLIAALADYLEKYPTDIDTTPTKLRNYYLLNAEEDGDKRFKLLLTRRDKETIMKLLKGIPQDENYSRRISENYDFFASRINSETVEEIYNGLQKLFVVDVALEKDKDNPQLIFESMNSTGLDLSQADLIRNFILMGLDIDTQTDLYERYWYPMEQSYGSEYASTFDWFMRDYLSVKMNRIPKIDRVYEEFKQYAHEAKSAEAITGLVADIFKYSTYYINMVLLKEPEETLKHRFRNLLRLRVDVSYPFLLPVYADYKAGLLQLEEFEQVLHYVESYVYRRVICGIPTNSLNKTFATLYRSIEKTNYPEGVAAAFLLMESYKRFPADSEFKTELMQKDVYSLRSRNYLLGNLENYDRKEPVNTDEYTVEHILPQNTDMRPEWKEALGVNWKTIHERWLHTIGNITLTGYNSELSDRPFTEKKSIKGGFDDSPLRLNAILRKVDTWNEDLIVARAAELADLAVKIWKAPALSPETLAKYKVQEEEGESSSYNLEHYEHLNGAMLELYYSLRKRILNIDPSVREEYKKLYIAFKSGTNFVDIVPQKARLRLSLNMAFKDIIDPNNLCKDVTDLGRWGNGDVEVGVYSKADLDNVMDLIQQAFDAQLEEER